MNQEIQVTIHSDGIGGIVVSEDGKKLNNVYSATIWMEAKEATRVDIQMHGIPVNVRAVVGTVEMTCPLCEHVSEHNCEKTG